MSIYTGYSTICYFI